MFRSSPEVVPGVSGDMKACRQLSKVEVFCKITRAEVVFVCTAPCTNRSDLSIRFSIHLCGRPKGNSHAVVFKNCGSAMGSLREIAVNVGQQGHKQNRKGKNRHCWDTRGKTASLLKSTLGLSSTAVLVIPGEFPVGGRCHL